MSEPFEITDFQDAVQSWAATATGLTTIWERPGAPRPAAPYATLAIISGPTGALSDWMESDTYDEEGKPGEEISQEKISPAKITITCQIFANTNYETALEYALKAIAAAQLESVRNDFEDVNAAISNVESPRNVSALINSAQSFRVAFDVSFLVMLGITQKLGLIEHIHATSDELEIDQNFGLDLP